MTHPSTFLLAAVVMVLAGIGIPIMATLNAGLARDLGSPVAASATLYALALVITLVALALTGIPSRAAFTGAHKGFYLAALFNVFYVLTITWAAPRIGVGNAVFFVLIGQLAATAAIDHYGLWGALKTELSLRRVAGIAVMAIGLWLAKKQG